MKINKLIAGVVVMVLSMGLALGLHVAGFTEQARRQLSHSLYRTREVGDDIIIVGLDAHTLQDPSEGGLGSRSGWNRTTYKKVIENIEAGNPALVEMDILFSGASNSVTQTELIDLARAYPSAVEFTKAVLAYMGDPHPHDEAFAATLSSYSNIYFIMQALGKESYDEESDSFIYPYENKSFPPFSDVVKNGYYNWVTNEDSENFTTIDSLPMYFTVAGQGLEKQIVLMVAEAYLGHEIQVPTERGQMLINYAQKPNSYPLVSFADVFNGKIDPAVFEGKIVLIGATAEILQDNHFTPIDATSRMPGIEIQANAIQTLLDGNYLVGQSLRGFILASIIAIGALIAAFMWFPVLISSLVLILSLVLFPFVAYWSFGRGVILDLISYPAAILTAYLGVLAYRYTTEFREKRQLKMAFSRYVSPELADEITKKPELLKLGGEKRMITALFLDLENFTHLSEGLSPQEVVGIINTYFDALATVIMEHKGSVDKFEGDAIMALFGAPLPSEDHGIQACRAALAIRSKMDELNQMSGHELHIRIGLATGEAIVGNMGSKQRFDYTAMGDTVNTASRLEGANKFYKTRILVNPGTFESARNEIFFRQVDKVQLKGKDQAIEIYEILGTLEAATEGGKKVVDIWNRGLAAYQSASWEEADTAFGEVLKELPDDGPSTTLIKRIQELRLMPTLENWDGVWKFKTK